MSVMASGKMVHSVLTYIVAHHQKYTIWKEFKGTRPMFVDRRSGSTALLLE